MQPYFAAYVRATTGWRAELESSGNASYVVWIGDRWNEWAALRGRKRTGAGFVPSLTDDERADFGTWLDAVTS